MIGWSTPYRVWCRPVLPPDPFIHLLGCTGVSRLVKDMVRRTCDHTTSVSVSCGHLCSLHQLPHGVTASVRADILLSIRIRFECLLFAHTVLAVSDVTMNDMKSCHQLMASSSACVSTLMMSYSSTATLVMTGIPHRRSFLLLYNCPRSNGQSFSGHSSHHCEICRTVLFLLMAVSGWS